MSDNAKVGIEVDEDGRQKANLRLGGVNVTIYQSRVDITRIKIEIETEADTEVDMWFNDELLFPTGVPLEVDTEASQRE